MNFFFAVLLWLSSDSIGASAPTVILVDKATNQLKIGQYDDAEYRILKTYHVTVGQVHGDKEEEGDLKTPEGIYHFRSLLKPPAIRAELGAMAFFMDYPNAFDRIAGRTGSNIMLHATNEPERLKKNFDSKGCIVVRNEEIEEIKPYIRLNLTPILVFEKLTQEFFKPLGDHRLKEFFEGWIAAWESRDVDRYIDFYHSDFFAQNKDRNSWRNYKRSLTQRYLSISVGPEKVQYFRHPKYSLIQFVQNYRSQLKGGGTGHQSRGTKVLYVAQEDGKFKIIDEGFTGMAW